MSLSAARIDPEPAPLAVRRAGSDARSDRDALATGASRRLRSASWALAAWCLAAGAALAAGNPASGEAIVANRTLGLCTLCHAVPGQPAALQGNLGPPLAGVGARLDAQQLRDRLLAPERFNPDTVMPAYGRADLGDAGLHRVAPGLRGKPLLSPGQIDDVVAYLAGLQ